MEVTARCRTRLSLLLAQVQGNVAEEQPTSQGQKSQENLLPYRLPGSYQPRTNCLE